MGRKRHSLQVLQGKGATHLTKEQIKKRAAQEEKMRGKTDKIAPPSYLYAKQKREFEEISAQLVELGIFSNLDVDGLARYLDAKTEYQRVNTAIRKLKPTYPSEVDLYTKLNRARKSLSDECRAYANELGLTVNARLKLVMPEGEKRELTAAENRFKDRL